MLLFPCAALISLAMALLQHGSLPDQAADTHAHFLALTRRPHMLEEATYTGGLLVGEVVESPPSYTLTLGNPCVRVLSARRGGP